MKRLVMLAAALSVVVMAAGPAAQSAPAQRGKTLDIYVADTEGGKAALFVTPSGQTVLVDSGNPGERDHNRILAMLKDAGVSKLDYLVSTHYHVDHIGGLQELAQKVPVGTFVDHGPSVEAKEQVRGFQDAYAAIRAKAKHLVVKPGDKLPLAGVDWTIVSAHGAVLKKPLPGGGQPNPACAQTQKKPDPANPDDNASSVGSVVSFGQFRLVDLGDLLWNVEMELMCPNNPIGTVDLYMVTHHGLANSGPEALVLGVNPRVALMQNGTRKGGAPATYEVLRKAPRLVDIWQLHWSHNAGIEHNPAGVFIANVDEPATIASILTAPPAAGPAGRGGPSGPPAAAPGGQEQPPNIAAPPGTKPTAGPPPTGQLSPDQPPVVNPAQPAATPPQPPAGPPTASAPQGGQVPQGTTPPGGGRGAAAAAHSPAHYIKVSAMSDGSFTVTNTRNGFSRTYPATRK